jgi:hypothetical protein
MELAKSREKDIWEKVYKRNEDIVTRNVAGELFLVPIKGELADMQKIFVLNQVGEFIWQNLNDKNLNNICNDIVTSFEVEREEAESDILEFITEMKKEDLVRE